MRSRQADRQIKQLHRPSQKTDACSLFSVSYLAPCSLTTVFKVSAGGDTHSSAPWLLYKTSPVYLLSAAITLNAHLSHAAPLGKSLVFLCAARVCVNGTEGERAIKRIIVFMYSCQEVSFLLVRLLLSTSVLFGTESILFLLLTGWSVISCGSRIHEQARRLLWRSWCCWRRHSHEVISF